MRKAKIQLLEGLHRSSFDGCQPGLVVEWSKSGTLIDLFRSSNFSFSLSSIEQLAFRFAVLLLGKIYNLRRSIPISPVRAHLQVAGPHIPPSSSHQSPHPPRAPVSDCRLAYSFAMSMLQDPRSPRPVFYSKLEPGLAPAPTLFGLHSNVGV